MTGSTTTRLAVDRMDMPEALGRKLTDSSRSEMINKVGGFSGLIFLL